MAPGILAITLLAHRIKQLALNPGLTNGLILALLLVLLGLSTWFLSRRLRGNHEKKGRDDVTPSP
jgi:cytochrome oxidase assembly protein ShyY1